MVTKVRASPVIFAHHVYISFSVQNHSTTDLKPPRRGGSNGGTEWFCTQTFKIYAARNVLEAVRTLVVISCEHCGIRWNKHVVRTFNSFCVLITPIKVHIYAQLPCNAPKTTQVQKAHAPIIDSILTLPFVCDFVQENQSATLPHRFAMSDTNSLICASGM